MFATHQIVCSDHRFTLCSHCVSTLTINIYRLRVLWQLLTSTLSQPTIVRSASSHCDRTQSRKLSETFAVPAQILMKASCSERSSNNASDRHGAITQACTSSIFARSSPILSVFATCFFDSSLFDMADIYSAVSIGRREPLMMLPTCAINFDLPLRIRLAGRGRGLGACATMQ